jgi:linoleoyl-CoA desaturase
MIDEIVKLHTELFGFAPKKAGTPYERIAAIVLATLGWHDVSHDVVERPVGRRAEHQLDVVARDPSGKVGRLIVECKDYSATVGEGTLNTLVGVRDPSYAWRVKHNVALHTYTNVDGYDDDATQVLLARFAPSQAPKPWYRFQHYYIWPMYALMGLRWQTVGDIAAFARGSVGESALRAPRGWNLAGVIVGKAIFVTWAIAIPLLVYPWWAVLGAYIGFTMVTSLIMATTFQLAHCVEEASFASAEEVRAARPAWAVHEVETTVDFCPRNPVLTWMLGGLNFQIEHHLFPRVPHTHYPQIARIVRRNCARHGVRYSSQPSLRAALRSHFLHLRAMGRLGLPAEIEMG